MMDEQKTRTCPLLDMITYSLGECANSLVLNSLFGFAMLYYTDALGLNPSLAGIAIFIAIFWDAISDPIMGHITDNTRSRFGKRHIYLFFGGLLMAVGLFFVWYVPGVFKSSAKTLFVYLVVANLTVRTGFTAFFISYTALGFEMCTDYNGRTKLQGIRGAMNMAANFCGPALAWAIFFNSNEVVRATSVAKNYVYMGSVFSLAVLVFVLCVVLFTLKYMHDSRQMQFSGKGIKAFVVDMKEIITDVYPRWVFAYIFVVQLGVALVAGFQMYVFEHFMVLSGIKKSIAHGGTMLGFGLGAMMASIVTRWFDKRGAVCAGGFLSIFCEVLLAALFLPGILKPGQTFDIAGFSIPFAFIVFTFFHSAYWLGNGIMFPIATSMMADVSEIYEIKTGINKDGAYAAVFTFTTKCALAIGSLFVGCCLDIIGFKAGAEHGQTLAVLWRMCAMTMLVGPLVSLGSLALIRKYPVNKAFIEELRKETNS